MTGKRAIWVAGTIFLAVVAVVVLATASATGENKPAMESRPYQVASGKVAGDFNVVYVLDTAKGRLAVLKLEITKDTLVPVAGRDLAKDFGTKEPGTYSMTTVQLSGNRGLLYVTDQYAHKAVAYKVDIFSNSIVPMTPIDLNKVFEGS